MTRVFLGVDAGGSHTRAVLRAAAEIVGTGLAGPANWTALGGEPSVHAIAEAAGQALCSAGLDASQLTRACVALAGYFPPWHENEARVALAAALPGVSLHLVPDLIAAWAGATGGSPGIVLVAGTGAVAYGQETGGISARAGGWGPLFGDEGGGYWIGCEALRAVSRALDGCSAATSLVEVIRQHPNDPCGDDFASTSTIRQPARTDEEALRAVYRERWTRERVAALSKPAALHAAAGDRIAIEIFERAAGELGELVAAVARRLNWRSGPLLVYAVGGLIDAGRVLLGPLERRVAAVLPNARWRTPLGSPLDGALFLAQQEMLP